MNEDLITIDVREDIRGGRDPYSKIMSTVALLHARQKLLVIAPFKPEPLFQVLAKRGFRHDAQPTATGDWQVLFTPTEEACEATASTPPASSDRESAANAPTEIVEFDARGLEPPQPLVKILEALESLPANSTLRARTDRRPMHLYALLEERGFTGESQEQSDGSFITHVRRR